MRLWLAALAALWLGVTLAGAQSAPVAVPDGYRMGDYRAPVPDTVPGADTIGDAAAYALWRSGRVVFVDVMPDLPRPKGLPEDAVWQGRSRFSVPGALWLPGTGVGAQDAATLTYFETGLRHATAGDADAPVVIFCKASCWMSWNAARRAGEMGYTRLFWYPDGTDGWTLQDWPTEKLKRFQPE